MSLERTVIGYSHPDPYPEHTRSRYEIHIPGRPGYKVWSLWVSTLSQMEFGTLEVDEFWEWIEGKVENT